MTGTLLTFLTPTKNKREYCLIEQETGIEYYPHSYSSTGGLDLPFMKDLILK